LATGQLYVDYLVEQAESLARNNGGASARAAGLGFADATFEYPEIQIFPVPNAGKTDIDPLRKAFVMLDERPEFVDRGRVYIVHMQDAVRITHRHCANFELPAVHLEFVASGSLVGRERDLFGLEIRHSHADGDQSVVIDARLDRAGRAVQRKLLGVAVFAGQYARDAADAVAALFHLGAIRIEDPVTRGEGRVIRCGDPHQLVETGAGGLIAEFAKLLGRWWRQGINALIDDKYLVTCAVHFCVSNRHGLFRLASVVYITSIYRTITNLTTLPLESVMRHIMVMNAKGGCGKSTLATNIASYFVNEGATVALADYDPQRSSLDWLDRRPSNRPEIFGVAGFDGGLRRVPRNAEIVVIDAPARSHGAELTDLVKHAETIVVPVLPSTIDMQATTTFLDELRSVGKIERKQAKFGLVANRVRDNTLIFDDLDEYLSKARAPYVAALREAQNYVRAYTRGLGIFELPEYLAWPDWDEWEPLTAWLRSKRSQP